MKRFFLVLALLCVAVQLDGQERKAFFKIEDRIKPKTTGGIWFWGDVLFFHDYHIQKNVKTGTYRLLDDQARVKAQGDFEECRGRLNDIQVEEGLLPMSGSAVVILHGFGSNSLTTRPLADWLRRNDVYDHVFNMVYPSTQQPILDHADMLDRVVRNLPPTVKRIDFIGHSLGSIVIRRYLSGPLDPYWRVPSDRIEARKRFSPDPRIGRFIMLGPPNHGAEIARKLIGKDPLKRRFAGPSGDQLGIHWHETALTLGIPCCPFAIIAGGRGDDNGFSTLIPGDDDGIVSTEGTRLEGAEHWIQFHVGHGELLLTEEIFENVRHYLETGSFLQGK